MRIVNGEILELEGSDTAVVHSKDSNLAIFIKCNNDNSEGLDIEIQNKKDVTALVYKIGNKGIKVASRSTCRDRGVYVMSKGYTSAICIEEAVDKNGQVGYDIYLAKFNVLEQANSNDLNVIKSNEDAGESCRNQEGFSQIKNKRHNLNDCKQDISLDY